MAEEQPAANQVWHSPQLFLAFPDLLLAEKRIQYYQYGIPLYQAALKGNWDAVRQIIQRYNDGITAAITQKGDTALHIAALSKHTKFVENLVSSMRPNHLRIQNKVGNTALCLAAASGVVPIAKAMVDKSPDLPNIRGSAELTPLHMAALLGHRNMVNYLFPLTQNLTHSENYALLISTINAELYDVALSIVSQNPTLPIYARDGQLTPLHILARKSEECCVTQPSFWRLCHNLFSGLSEVEPTKSLPLEALQLVKCLWERVLMLPEAGISRLIAEPSNLLFDAAKAGNVEFLSILIRSYPDLIWKCDINSKTIFHVAVEYRQEKVFRLIHEFGSIKDLLASYIDLKYNTMLHLAARLPSPDRLNSISGPGFQMQREMQWFKVVEGLLGRQLARSENEENETARVIFSKEHKKLRKKGEKWMRITAASYSVVATLIVTMVFSAAAKVLVGNDNKQYWEYFAFAIFDAVSFVYSSASLLVFLSILTSRYAEDDFLESLPHKLLIGLILLVFSIATMIMAFFTIFYISFRPQFIWIVLPGLPGILIIVVLLLWDSLLLMYRLMADHNILQKPLRRGLLDRVNLSSLSLTSNFTTSPV